MQGQCDDLAGGEPRLGQIGKEEFVDHARPRDANGILLLTSRMGRDDHAARQAFSANRHFWTVREAAHALAFRTLVGLLRRQLQARLHERMSEDGVLLAARHKSEPGEVGQGRSCPIVSVEPCAAVRGLISPVQPGRTRKEVLESPCLPGTERRRETQHAWKAMVYVKTLR